MNKNGFTLIEMLIVLMIISILLLITIPNVTKHNNTINDKGCQAFIKMTQAQVEAYQMEHDDNTIPTIAELNNQGYITQTKCPNGGELGFDVEGNVIELGTGS
jgi:competence protein ComGC